MTRDVRLIAPLHNRSGYAKAGRGILAALISAGYTVEAIEAEADVHTAIRQDMTVYVERLPMHNHPMHPEQEREVETAIATRVSPDAPTIIMSTPDMFTQFPEYPNKRIGLTMWESDRLTEKWARRIKSMDAVIVPSEWNANAVNSGNVSVIPLCVDERCWSAEGDRYVVKNRPDFLFLSVFATSPRKNWQEMFSAFAEEFWGESVGLLVRASGKSDAVIDLATQYRKMGVWIECVEHNLNEEEMAALYREADCFVLPSTEGFGMPYVEALLCGTRSIGLAGQAGGETVESAFGLVVREEYVPSLSHLPHIYPPTHETLKPEYPNLRKVLRLGQERYTKQDPIKLAGMQFSREAIGAKLSKVIEQVRGTTRRVLDTTTNGCCVIMLTYNHIEKTIAAVESLKRTSPQVSLLVVDDGSTDGTQEWLKENGVAVLESPTHNIAVNWNKGIERLLGEGFEGAVVFSDNDVVYQEGWFEGLCTVLYSADDIGIAAPTKRTPDGGLQNCGCYLDTACVTHDNHVLRQSIETDYVETACMMVRYEVWKTLRIDERFPIFYNDVGYCMDARAEGWRVVATDESVILHDPHTTSMARAHEVPALRGLFIQKYKETLRA